VSGSLTHRADLRQELEGLRADVYLTEIKAAAIDIVAETAASRDVPVVLADNEVVPVVGDLDAEIVALAEAAIDEQAVPA
jgi:cyclic 2,3-diphosphoglycerate synthetase